MPTAMRVDAVRAGWEFPEYQWLLRESKEGRINLDEYRENIEYIERNLSPFFRNPAFPLSSVMELYIDDKGSNEILEMAFHGLPDYSLNWFRMGQCVRVTLEKLARGQGDKSGIEVIAIDSLMARAGINDSERREILLLLTHAVGNIIENTSKYPMAVQRLDNKLQEIAAKQDRPIMKPNIWINGSFYLLALLAIIASVRVISGQIAPYWIAVVLVGGIFSILTIGVLALRSSDQMSDKSFTANVRLILNSLPIIGRLIGK